MLITISGPSSSGKSTTAKELSKALGIPTMDSGQIFRQLAKRHKMDVVTFGEYVLSHPEIDHEFDAMLIAAARRRKNLILQGRLSGLMTAREGIPATRIWVDAKVQTRARRMGQRDGIPYAKALKLMAKRDRTNRLRYKKAYGLDVNDLSVYSIVVRTDTLSVEKVVSSLVKKLTPLWQTNRKPRKSPPKPLPRLKPRPKARSRK